MRLTRRIFLALGLVLLLAVAALAAGFGYLRASLPQLDGEAALAGLAAPVTVLRDARGAPTVRAQDRADLARATGYLHAQDRFFQMDLLRRSAAGELAELVGAAALPMDRQARLHGLRRVAARVLEREPAQRRALVQAYAQGVNAGLAALGARPPEYALLRAAPQPWRPEDTVLVIFAMYFDLQDENADREAQLALMRGSLPPGLTRFLTRHDSRWDAPLDGSVLPVAPLPGPEVYDLRRRQSAGPTLVVDETRSDDRMVGSNNWAVGPAVSADGAAWLADDMHLGLSVPNVWYRMRLEWGQEGARRALTGVTLPGAPAMVAGSNGQVAWGFTNSYGDFSDLILLELDPENPNRYRTPEGYRLFTERVETLAVKGGEPVRIVVRETIWGPVVAPDARGRPRALRWAAHDPEATNMGLLGLEQAGDLEAAFAAARRAGVPAQNFLAVDQAGNLGWTIIGRIPRRVGFSGEKPVSWADGAGWRGYLAPSQYPQVINPADGRLWTANNRVIGGEGLARLGDGGYALGARAQQIRDGLRALERATPADLLALQLDDRAIFLARWQQLLLDVLDEQAVAGHPRRAALRQAVQDWGGRAAVDSVGYRMVRGFRLYVSAGVFGALTAELRAAQPEFRFDLPQAESALWQLVSERPAHLLDRAYADWDALLLTAADRLLDARWHPQAGLAKASWGRFNTLRMTHPLSRAVPALGPWLDMPAVPLPGDAHMPRVQAPRHGASERLVVSPGREAKSILQLPGGQSGHPLSPFYGRGHEDWARGRPTPLLPGPEAHRLRLLPAGEA